MVVGGGYIGVEMAEALIQRGLAVTLVERAEQPMATVDADMAGLVAEAMRGLGIEIRSGTTVTGVEQRDGRVSAVLTPAGPVPADVVVLGLGVRPNTALAAAAGFPLGPTGGITGGPADAGGRGAGRLGGRRLRGDPAPGHRHAGAHRRSAPTPTSRAGSPGSTSAAGTPPSPG